MDYQWVTCRVNRLVLVMGMGGSVLLASCSRPLSDGVVFEDDFSEGGQKGWSQTQTEKTPAEGNQFLGTLGGETVSLTLEDLPPHQWVTLSFDLYAIKSWNGNSVKVWPDLFNVTTDDDRVLIRTTFSKYKIQPQAYPGLYPVHAVPRKTGATAENTLGYLYKDKPMDAVYRVTRTFPHQGPELTLFFDAVLTRDKEKEAWGLDNVKVTVSQEPPGRNEQSLEELWTQLANEDAGVSAAAVDQFILRNDAAVPFLAAKLEGTSRPLLADSLLKPSSVLMSMPVVKGEKKEKAPVYPEGEDRQRMLGAFALQAIGSPDAQASLAAWLPEEERETVAVRFVDTEGEPVPFAVARVRGSETEYPTGRADRHGTMEVRLPKDQPNRFTVRNRGAKWLSEGYEWNFNTDQDKLPSEIEIAMKSQGVIGGRVVDTNGQPIEGATVFVTAYQEEGNRHSIGGWGQKFQTDADGRWVFETAPLDGVYFELGVTHPHFAQSTNRGYYDIKRYPKTEELRDQTAVLKLESGVPVRGMVRDQNGEPLANAEVALGLDRVASNTRPSIRTEEDGTFRLAAKPGEATAITVQAKNHAPGYVKFTPAEGADALEIQLTSPQVLKGRVVDDEGKPLSGIHVAMDTWEGLRTLRHRIKTKKDGSFEWKEAPAQVIKADVFGGGRADSRGVAIQAGKENEIVLGQPTRVKFTVLDEATGNPLPSFVVYRGTVFQADRPPSWSYSHPQYGRDGVFEQKMNYPQQGYYFRIMATGYDPQVSKLIPHDGHEHEQTFRLKKGEGVPFKVVNAEGKAMEGAVVLMAEEGSHIHVEKGKLHPHYQNSVLHRASDAAGQVSLAPVEAPYLLLALHDSGYAVYPDTELPENGELVLRPWSHVEATARLGTQVDAGADYGFYAVLPYSETNHDVRINFMDRATTDGQGRFRVEKVPATAVSFGRYQSNRCTYSINAQTEPGQTLKLEIGGKGRPVVGKLNLPPELKEKAWTLPMATIREKQAPRSAPVALTKKLEGVTDAKEAQKIQVEWHQSEEGKAYRAEMHAKMRKAKTYPIDWKPDGTLRADNVEPGTYEIHLQLNEAPEARQCGWGDLLARGRVEFTIAPIPGGVTDEVFDFGLVDLDMVNQLKVGQAAPDFSVERVNGKGNISLADFKGKYVLIDFWATWCGPCVAETPHLQAVYKEFGQRKDFTILGLSQDRDKERLQAYLKKNKIAWPQGFLGADTSVPLRYGVHGIPSLWLIGPDGTVLAKGMRGPAIAEKVRNVLRLGH